MPDLIAIGIETRLPVQLRAIGIETRLPVQLRGVGVELSAGGLIGLTTSLSGTGIAYDGAGPALGTLGSADQVVQGSDGTIGNTPASQGVDITP